MPHCRRRKKIMHGMDRMYASSHYYHWTAAYLPAHTHTPFTCLPPPPLHACPLHAHLRAPRCSACAAVPRHAARSLLLFSSPIIPPCALRALSHGTLHHLHTSHTAPRVAAWRLQGMAVHLLCSYPRCKHHYSRAPLRHRHTRACTHPHPAAPAALPTSAQTRAGARAAREGAATRGTALRGRAWAGTLRAITAPLYRREHAIFRCAASNTGRRIQLVDYISVALLPITLYSLWLAHILAGYAVCNAKTYPADRADSLTPLFSINSRASFASVFSVLCETPSYLPLLPTEQHRDDLIAGITLTLANVSIWNTGLGCYCRGAHCCCVCAPRTRFQAPATAACVTATTAHCRTAPAAQTTYAAAACATAADLSFCGAAALAAHAAANPLRAAVAGTARYYIASFAVAADFTSRPVCAPHHGGWARGGACRTALSDTREQFLFITPLRAGHSRVYRLSASPMHSGARPAMGCIA